MKFISLIAFSCAVFGLAAYWVYQEYPINMTNIKADQIQVFKSERKLVLLKNGEPIKTYRISLGRNPEGHKFKEGDSRTPEGIYKIDWRNKNSAYFLSLHISYPNQQDKNRAARNGLSPGGNIMIHGVPNGFGIMGLIQSWFDWTSGCVAITNHEMLEIWDAVPNGTPIEIRG